MQKRPGKAIVFILAFLLLGPGLFICGVDKISAFEAEGFRLHGYLQHRSDFSVDSPRRYTHCENTIQAEFNYKVPVLLEYEMQMHGIFRATYDAIYDIRDDFNFKGDIRDAQIDEEAEMRELYLDLEYQDINFRIGKQVVIWGEADGFPLMDLVMPWDYRRHYLTGDFEDMRLPLRMARVNYSLPWNSIVLEGLWIPEHFRKTILAPVDAPFAPPPYPGVSEEQWSYAFNELVKDHGPDDDFSLQRWGFKVSGFFWGYDVSLNYLNTIQDAGVPQLFRDISEGKLLTMKYPRSQILGATFNKDYGPIVLRGEAAYFFDKAYNTSNFGTNPDLYTDRDVIKTMLGVDRIHYSTHPLFRKFFDTGLFLSAQIFNFHVFDHDHDMVVLPYFTEQRKDEWYATFLFNTFWCQNKFYAEFLLARDITHDGWWIKPKFEYAPGQVWRFQVGANVFDGTNNLELPLGPFDDRDEVYVQVRYMF